MTNTLRIKRRASGGSGAPASLQNAELAYNEVDDVLYYGKGTGGAGGSATTVQAIAGTGAYVALTGAQTVAGVKTFSSTIAGSVNGNAATATTLATARDLSLTGDATATLSSFNGSANVSATLTLANSGVSAATYGTSTAVGQFTVDAKGRITTAAAVNIAFPVTSVNSATGAVVLTTTNIAEGTNLYYTDTRVRANRLDQLAVPTAAVSLNSQRITSLAEPSASTDAATKNYVDSVAQGLDVKTSVVAATTANITLSAPQTIDGIAVIAGNRVLVKNQTTASQNGIYLVAAGSWTRTTDTDTFAELVSAFVFIESGTVNADTGYVCTVDPGGTLGSTNITFAQFSGAGTFLAGNGLALTGNSFSVTGTASRISVSGSGVDIASTYVGQSSITTLGTITTGVWNGTAIAVANGGTGATTAPLARTALGATTVGSNLFTLTNPSAITFLRLNADNTVSALDAPNFRTAIGAGTSSTTGTVTSVSGTGTVSGLTLSGTVTTSGSLTLGGTLAVTASNFASQTANTILAAPNGSAGVPTFRAIVAADVPTLNQNTTGTASNVTGTVAVANGGTGATTLTGYVKGSGTSALTASATIPSTDITGLGTMSTQAASNVAITGGSISNLTTFDGITIDGGTF